MTAMKFMLILAVANPSYKLKKDVEKIKTWED